MPDRRLSMFSLVATVRRLWAGEVPLAHAFWDYAVVGGLSINLLATVAALALIVAGAPAIAAVGVHMLPMPYNLVILVAVWRSAGRYAGAVVWRNLARAAIVLWTAVATVV